MTLKIARDGSVSDSAALREIAGGVAPLAAQEHPGTGVPMTAVEHPADGTWSPEIGNDPVPGEPGPGQVIQEPEPDPVPAPPASPRRTPPRTPPKASGG